MREARLYAARDEDGTLVFSPGRMERLNKTCGGECFWDVGHSDSFEWSREFGSDPLPELSWKDEPVMVRVIVKGVDPVSRFDRYRARKRRRLANAVEKNGIIEA